MKGSEFSDGMQGKMSRVANTTNMIMKWDIGQKLYLGLSHWKTSHSNLVSKVEIENYQFSFRIFVFQFIFDPPKSNVKNTHV